MIPRDHGTGRLRPLWLLTVQCLINLFSRKLKEFRTKVDCAEGNFMRAWLNEWNYWTLLLLGAGRQRKAVSKPTCMVWDVAYGQRASNYRETKKISWSIKQSDFSRLMSFPSSSRRERISSSGPLGKGMEMGDGRDGDVFVISSMEVVGGWWLSRRGVSHGM